MKNPEHWQDCQAPICARDTINPNYKHDVVWYPGETICGQTPYQPFQFKQAKINRFVAKGQFKHPDRYFTAEMLEKRSIIRKEMKGGNPDL
jgi:hypothetical protein